MKIAATIARLLMGLMFLFASLTYFFKLITPPPMTGAIDTFNKGVEASVYLMPLVKILELLCGLAFVSGRFVRLAVIVILPVVVNIVCVNAFMMPPGLGLAIPLALCEIFLIWFHRDAYRPMLQR